MVKIDKDKIVKAAVGSARLEGYKGPLDVSKGERADHPFREGNGRAIRFYLDVLSARVRGDIFDWTLTDEEEYIRACVAGFGQDYEPLTALLKRCAA